MSVFRFTPPELCLPSLSTGCRTTAANCTGLPFVAFTTDSLRLLLPLLSSLFFFWAEPAPSNRRTETISTEYFLISCHLASIVSGWMGTIKAGKDVSRSADRRLRNHRGPCHCYRGHAPPCVRSADWNCS